MIGQWIGLTCGTNKGVVVMNIEGPIEGSMASWGGRIMFTDFDNSNVNSYCIVQFDITENNLRGKLFDFYVFDDIMLQLEKQAIFKNLHPTSTTSKSGEIEGVLNGDKIDGTWSTDIGATGNFSIQKREEITRVRH